MKLAWATLGLLLGPAMAVDTQQSAEDPIVVTAVRIPIVVTGRVRRCARRPGDSLDAIDLSNVRAGAQMMIARDPVTNRFALAPDNDPIGGADWQRAGTGLPNYVFRAPVDGTPLCIGARSTAPQGFGQLRQIVDATPFIGHGVRFSGYIASEQGAPVRLWLAAGLKKRGVVAGNSTPTVAMKRKSHWTTFVLEIPYVPKDAWSISYGFLLDGPGDVWVYQPRLDAVNKAGRSRDLKATPIK